MARVFFPTYSLNRFGVRDTDQAATLGAAPADKFYQEPSPRAAMNPTGPMLGAVAVIPDSIIRSPIVYASENGWPGIPMPGPMPRIPMPPSPMPQTSIAPTSAPISSSGGGGTAPTPASPPIAAPLPGVAPPVSAQQLPTPTVATPQTADTGTILISSGGGVATPSTAPIVAAPASSTGLVDGVAAWLGASTTLFGYNVPNALLAGIVVLGFAWLSSSGKKR